MASLRIVGIDPASSGANQLAAQGLDTVLINDIHGSTALNLVSTAGSLGFFTGGTAASNKVLTIGTGSASFNPNSLAAFGGVTVAGGTASNALSVTSPATTNQTTLKVTQLGTVSALEVFGTGTALLQMGDPGTFLYNKINSDMELFTYGTGSTFIQGGATGTMEISAETNTVGAGAAAYVTGGASSSAAHRGGDVFIAGGTTNSTLSSKSAGSVSIVGGNASSAGTGGAVSVSGGNSTSGVAGSVTIKGGISSTVANSGGSLSLDGGTNSVSTDPNDFGDVTIGTVGTNFIRIGGSSFSSLPGSVVIKGHAVTAAGLSAGAVTVDGGQSTSSSLGGAVTITGGSSSSGLGGETTLSGGSSTSFIGGTVTVSGGASTSSTGGDALLLGGTTGDAGQVGGKAIIRAGRNTALLTSPSAFSLVSIGDAYTNAITIGGGAFSTGPKPGSVEITGHSSASAPGGDVVITSGGNSVVTSAAGALWLNGGVSAAGNGGGVVIGAGNSSSVSKVGGSVAINAGVGGNGLANSIGSLFIGNSSANLITIGNASLSSLAFTPGPVSIIGHAVSSTDPNDTSNGSDVIVRGGLCTTKYGRGGNVLIDPGDGLTGPAAGIISMLATNGDTISIGDGTVVPQVNIRDGYLSFTDTTATSDSNPSSTTFVVKNSLYAKNTVDAWLLAFSQNVQDGFGLSSVSFVASGLGVRVTFRNSATGSLAQSFFLTGHPSTPFYLTANSFAVNAVTIRGWNSSGVEVNLNAGTLVWQLLRMAEIA